MRNGIEEHHEVRLLWFTLDVDWPVPLFSGCVVEWGFWGAGACLGSLGLGVIGDMLSSYQHIYRGDVDVGKV